MPDTYTKEQIGKAKTITFQTRAATELELLEAHEILLSALSTAEQERDAYRKASVGDYAKLKLIESERDQYQVRVETAEQAARSAQEQRDALAARCAELEARLLGAADRWENFERENLHRFRFEDRIFRGRAAILGEKKED